MAVSAQYWWRARFFETFRRVLNLAGNYHHPKQVTQGTENLHIRRHSLELFNGSIAQWWRTRALSNLRRALNQWDNYHYHRERLLKGTRKNYSNIRRHSPGLFNGSIRSVVATSARFGRLAASSQSQWDNYWRDWGGNYWKYNLKPRLPTAAPQGGEDKEKNMATAA